jgi:hypothetical protein
LKRQHNSWLVGCLADRSGENSDAAQIAEATISLWRDIAAALHSIIGRQGVAALYDRSVFLTAKSHPWMGHLHAGSIPVDLPGLQSVLAGQDSRDAAAGAGELVQTFYEVLVSLIGPALCEQLLLSVQEGSAHTESRVRKL